MVPRRSASTWSYQTITRKVSPSPTASAALQFCPSAAVFTPQWRFRHLKTGAQRKLPISATCCNFFRFLVDFSAFQPVVFNTRGAGRNIHSQFKSPHSTTQSLDESTTVQLPAKKKRPSFGGPTAWRGGTTLNHLGWKVYTEKGLHGIELGRVGAATEEKRILFSIEKEAHEHRKGREPAATEKEGIF
ncbi:hypothetical protein LR48_Vigan216s000100 [Vigna angularis]|uniref:Uncharacterized protein n=1 Tax=Phaseolus angularis TaxID=3914 RepID=A0A0L9T7E8_PHAAN|nr:hypothetical protein LR48_Vigan216s000100 [Vigna angularis]